MNDNEPTLTRSVLAGIIGAVALLVIARLNRSIDLFDAAELDQAKALLALAGPVIAGVLIRRRVTPNAKVEERVSTVEAMVYAKALQDTTARGGNAEIVSTTAGGGGGAGVALQSPAPKQNQAPRKKAAAKKAAAKKAAAAKR